MENVFELRSKENVYIGKYKSDSPGFAARTMLDNSADLKDYDQEIKLELIDENKFRVLTGGKEYLLIKIE